MNVGDRVQVDLSGSSEPGWTGVEDLDGLNGVVTEVNDSAAIRGMAHILVRCESSSAIKDPDAYFYPTELRVI